MDYNKCMAEYDEAAQRLFFSGLQTGVGGNISLRVPGGAGMLIKSSGKTMAKPVLTNWNGQVLEGIGKPSSEFLMHSEIYKLRPDCNGIVHVHSNWAVSWSLTGKDIPLITFTAKLKLSAPVPVISIKNNNIGVEDFLAIAQHLKNTETRAFILRGHGLVCLGPSIISAAYHAELVEECAQIAWNAMLLQRLDLLPPDFEDFHGMKM